jgi:nucleolar GTP-binding protein
VTPAASVEILDVAFHRASLASPRGSSKAERDRLRARLKIVRSGATVIRQLQYWTRPFRSASFSPFDATLVSARFGQDTLERSLTRVARAQQRIRGLQQESERAVLRASDSTMYGDEVRRFYGRLASHVREIDPDLARLREVQRFLKDRPHLEAGAPTLVVAGFPNVGKSALVAKLSSAHPKVAEYAFTTLAIEVGHADLGFDRWQILDTPGVLGRAGRSNLAEREASVAVERAASIVLFVIDPSESSGYSIEEQERLLARWQEEMPGRPIIVVESKSDIAPDRGSGRLRVSAVTGEGLDALRDAIQAVRSAQPPPISEEETAAPDELEAPTFDIPSHGASSDPSPRERRGKHPGRSK